jgi:hypothetical protein
MDPGEQSEPTFVEPQLGTIVMVSIRIESVSKPASPGPLTDAFVINRLLCTPESPTVTLCGTVGTMLNPTPAAATAGTSASASESANAADIPRRTDRVGRETAHRAVGAAFLPRIVIFSFDLRIAPWAEV